MCLSSLGSDHMVFCAVRRMLRLHTFLHLLFAVWWRILPVSRGGIVETNIKAKCSQAKRKKKLKNTPQLVEHRQLRGIISITAGILSLPKTVDGNEKNTLSYMNIDSFLGGFSACLFCSGVWWSGGILASMSACSGIWLLSLARVLSDVTTEQETKWSSRPIRH